jgi:phosphoribosylaminoimidazolecarboxamide formyltransferase/IMP cyclohydrolase
MRAILSVSDKTGLASFARGLADRQVEIISTGGTANALKEAGLSVRSVSEVTGFPELLEGRIKTLHPAIHGGILARRSRTDDLEAIAGLGISTIDLVVVNLYPFGKAAADPSAPFDDLVEQIDIGGPSLVRAAAKNFRDVLVVVDPADYPRVLDHLSRADGPTLPFRLELMRKAFRHTAEYDGTIARTLMAVKAVDGEMQRVAPGTAGSDEPKPRELRYGENPHQKAAWGEVVRPYGEPWKVHQGKELSYTNLLDLDAAARIVLEFKEPAAAVIKHTNPCGVATGRDISDAFRRARDADPLSAYGGIVAVNRTVDLDAARALTATFIEAVIAPAVSGDGMGMLGSKPNLRVVTVDFSRILARDPRGHGEMRSFLGGVLFQDPDRVAEAAEPWPSGDSLKVVTRREPTADEWVALRFAWRVCAHVKSNAVIFTGADRTLAIGAGQMSRVDAVKVAVMKAAPGALAGSVAASDAFFPFRDGLDAIATAGATAVVQPGGSVRDEEVIAAADEHGLAMVFTGRRHFRH